MLAVHLMAVMGQKLYVCMYKEGKSKVDVGGSKQYTLNVDDSLLVSKGSRYNLVSAFLTSL